MGDANGAKLLSAAEIVDAIVEDISDRRWLRHKWKAIDEDVRAEIKRAWAGIVGAHLDALTAPTDGEALGRLLHPILLPIGLVDWERLDPSWRASMIEGALALHARGVAAGLARGEEERARLTAERDAPIGCGDHSCDVAPPGGMGTNGHCRCDEVALRRAVRAMRRTIAALRAELTEATARRQEAEALVAGMSAAVVEAKCDGAREEQMTTAAWLREEGQDSTAMRYERSIKARGEGGAG